MGVPPGFLADLTMTGGTAPIRTAFATRPVPWPPRGPIRTLEKRPDPRPFLRQASGQVTGRRWVLRARVSPARARTAAAVSAIADAALPGTAQVGSYMSANGPSAPTSTYVESS